MQETVPVNTPSGKYGVLIGEGLDFGQLALEVKKPCKRPNVAALFGNLRIVGQGKILIYHTALAPAVSNGVKRCQTAGSFRCGAAGFMLY